MSLRKWQNLKISIATIKEATNNFEKCIGKGGYGDVYYGEMSIHRKLYKVAVKRLNEHSGQGLKEFLTEIDLLSGQEHNNIISLLGYCDENNEKILVYEHAQRGSFDQYILKRTLTWIERLRICVDAARGVDHLHNHAGEHQAIIHRDIKSANILIDENWVAKVSDLGLSKLSLAGLDRSALVSTACGTPGYCEPEYVATDVVKKESDVYSFGMVLFEVLCGRLCNIIYDDGFKLSAKLAKHLYENEKLDEIVDHSIRKQMDSVSLEIFSTIAYRCLQDDRKHRPLMDLVMKELQESLKLQEEYESVKEEKLKSSQPTRNVEFDSDEYWKMKLPNDIEDIIKRLDSPEDFLTDSNTRSQKFYWRKRLEEYTISSYSSNKKLYQLLRRGVLFDHGLRVLSITEEGTKCETILSEAFLKWKPRGTMKPNRGWNEITEEGSRGRSRHGSSRAAVTGMYPHIEELNLNIRISTSMLSSGIMYAARLICSFGLRNGTTMPPNYVWIKWQCQELRVSSAHFAEIVENRMYSRHIKDELDDDVSISSTWKTTLWHFVNNDKNAYFDIVINRILGGSEKDYSYVVIHGIEFHPVEMKKQHNESDELKGFSIFDYQDIYDRSDSKLEHTAKRELYLLLCGGIYIDYGRKWLSICKSTGLKCLMLQATDIFSSATTDEVFEALSCFESRFKQVIRIPEIAEFCFKCEYDTNLFLTRKENYSCYLVFKLLDDHNKPHDTTCVLRVSSNETYPHIKSYVHLKLRQSINIPIIKPAKQIKFRDSWNSPKTKGSLVPKRYIDGNSNNFMEQRNDGWMEVFLFTGYYNMMSPLNVYFSCVNGNFHELLVQGIEFR